MGHLHQICTHSHYVATAQVSRCPALVLITTPSVQYNCLPHSHICTSAEVPSVGGGRSRVLTPAGPGESPVSTPEAEFPEWAELLQIIFPPLRVITSSKFHHPLWVANSFLYGFGLLSLYCPAPFSSGDLCGSDTGKPVMYAPSDLKETPKHLDVTPPPGRGCRGRRRGEEGGGVPILTSRTLPARTRLEWTQEPGGAGSPGLFPLPSWASLSPPTAQLSEHLSLGGQPVKDALEAKGSLGQWKDDRRWGQRAGVHILTS